MPFGIYSGDKDVTAAGTAEHLVDASLEVKWIRITAKSANTENVGIGDSTVNATAATEVGTILDALQYVELFDVDLYEIYVDADVNGEGVTYTYLA